MTKYITYIMIMLPVYSHRDSVPFDWLCEPCPAKTGLWKITPLISSEPLLRQLAGMRVVGLVKFFLPLRTIQYRPF